MKKPTDRLTSVCLVILTTIAVSAALIYTRTIMIPFVLAVFIAFILLPMKLFLEQRLRIPSFLSLTIILLGIGLFGTLFSLMVSSAIRQVANNAELYELRFIQIFEMAVAMLIDFGVNINLKETSITSLVGELPVFSFIRTLTLSTVKGVTDTFLVFIFVMFLLAGSSFRMPTTGIWAKVDTTTRKFLVTKMITSSVTGGLTAIILSFFQLDMALMFGFFAFILNFIPTVGSIIATLLPLPIAFLQFSDPLQVVLVIGLPGMVQFSIGNIIEPKFMGQSLDLHPVTILLSLMFWGLIWGAPGMILATPITVILKLFLEKSEHGKDLAYMMSGKSRPAASSVQPKLSGEAEVNS
ncbi:MAG: AI-2E family transporter [Oligoflexus sp.]